MRITSAAAGIMLAGSAIACGSTSAPAPTCVGATRAASCAPFDVVAALSDYSSSAVGGLDLDGGQSFETGTDLGSDPALTVSRSRTFFLARDLGLLFEIDSRCGRALSSESVNVPGHLGTPNPQDVAIAPNGDLWVP